MKYLESNWEKIDAVKDKTHMTSQQSIFYKPKNKKLEDQKKRQSCQFWVL